METILVRNSGKVRRATLNGRKYLVAKAAMIVPGVLNGSKGALYYPADEVAHQDNIDAWNGIPVTVGHPTDEYGQAISARNPATLEKYQIGQVYNSHVLPKSKKQAGEVWFDQELCANKAPQVLELLKQGKPFELSTGLHTKNTPAPAGSVHNGKSYDFVARKYRPDHLAILLDQVGACSLRDGCGVLAANTKDALGHGSEKHGGGTATTRPEPTVDLSQVKPLHLSPESADYTNLRNSAESTSRKAHTASLEAPIHGDVAKHSLAARTASSLADRGGKGISGRTNGGRHSSLHKKAARAHEKARDEHQAQASRLAISQPDAALKHAKASKAHDAARSAHIKAGHELMITGNQSKPKLGEPMKKSEAVTFLTTNCECWQGEGDDKTLNALPVEKLKTLVEKAQEAIQNQLTVNALKGGLGDEAFDEFSALAVNEDTNAQATEFIVNKMMDSEMEADENLNKMDPKPPAGKSKKGKKSADPQPDPKLNMNTETPVPTPAKPLTLNEWMETAPPEVREVVQSARAVTQQNKETVVKRLVANSQAKSKAQKDGLVTHLMKKSLDELNTLSLLSTNKSSETRGPAPLNNLNFAGLEQSFEEPVTNEEEDQGGREILGIPTVNWADEAKMINGHRGK